jgi:hypothetical protein
MLHSSAEHAAYYAWWCCRTCCVMPHNAGWHTGYYSEYAAWHAAPALRQGKTVTVSDPIDTIIPLATMAEQKTQVCTLKWRLGNVRGTRKTFKRYPDDTSQRITSGKQGCHTKPNDHWVRCNMAIPGGNRIEWLIGQPQHVTPACDPHAGWFTNAELVWALGIV